VGGHTDPSSGILNKGGVCVGLPSRVSSKSGVVGGRKAFEGPLTQNTREGGWCWANRPLHLMLQVREGLWLCQRTWGMRGDRDSTCYCIESRTSCQCLSVKLDGDVLWAYLATSHSCLPQ